MTAPRRPRAAPASAADDLEFWARREPDGSYRLGFTEHSQRALGPVAFLRGPTVGRRYRAEESALTLESEKCVRQVMLPASGTVLESNPSLAFDPGLVNRDPYGRGWVCRLRPARTAALESATARPPRSAR